MYCHPLTHEPLKAVGVQINEPVVTMELGGVFVPSDGGVAECLEGSF